MFKLLIQCYNLVIYIQVQNSEDSWYKLLVNQENTSFCAT